MLTKFFMLLQSGRCHSKSTLFSAHVFETSMQVRRSTVEPSFEKTVIKSSGGKLLTGDCRHRSRSVIRETDISRKVVIPIDDWESLAWAVKKSVSSYGIRSGELAEEDSDVALLEERCAPLKRGMMEGGREEKQRKKTGRHRVGRELNSRREAKYWIVRTTSGICRVELPIARPEPESAQSWRRG